MCQKPFDKLNHSVLFLKLMKRHVPAAYNKVLSNWYNNVSIYVKWNNEFSKPFSVKASIRQGGILSPRLFLIYVDLLIKLNQYGCNILGHPVSAFMYAGDLILLSPSVNELQKMLTQLTSSDVN